MKFFKSIREVFCGKSVEDEDNLELKKIAKWSESEIAEMARVYGEQEGWMPGAIQIRPKLKYGLRNKLTWEIFFRQESENGLPLKGGHLILFIDDETGNLIDKVIGTR